MNQTNLEPENMANTVANTDVFKPDADSYLENVIRHAQLHVDDLRTLHAMLPREMTDDQKLALMRLVGLIRNR